MVSAGHVILHCLPLIGHNLLLVYYQFEYKGNFYKYGLYYTWDPNVITDRTFITLGLKMLLRMRLLLRLGPNVITQMLFITLGSNYYTCAFYTDSEFHGH